MGWMDEFNYGEATIEFSPNHVNATVSTSCSSDVNLEQINPQVHYQITNTLPSGSVEPNSSCKNWGLWIILGPDLYLKKRC